MRTLLYICLVAIFCSCAETAHHRLSTLQREWTGKTIYFPPDTLFESFRTDSIRPYTLKRTTYTVVTYVDSSACAERDLKLPAWNNFLSELRRFPQGHVTCLFFFHPQKRSALVEQLRSKQFHYPVCIDETDCFNQLNHFPLEESFRTFLLNADREVVAFGNPITDQRVRERYLKLIGQGEPSVG